MIIIISLQFRFHLSWIQIQHSLCLRAWFVRRIIGRRLGITRRKICTRIFSNLKSFGWFSTVLIIKGNLGTCWMRKLIIFIFKLVIEFYFCLFTFLIPNLIKRALLRLVGFQTINFWFELRVYKELCLILTCWYEETLCIILKISLKIIFYCLVMFLLILVLWIVLHINFYLRFGF